MRRWTWILGLLGALSGCSSDDPVRPVTGETSRFLVVEGNLSHFDLIAYSQMRQAGDMFAGVDDVQTPLAALVERFSLENYGLGAASTLLLRARIAETWIEPREFVVSAGGADRLVDVFDWVEAVLAEESAAGDLALARGRVTLSPRAGAALVNQLRVSVDVGGTEWSLLDFVHMPEDVDVESFVTLLAPPTRTTLLSGITLETGWPLLNRRAPDTTRLEATHLVIVYQGAGDAATPPGLDVDYDTTTVADLFAWLEGALDLGGDDGSGATLDDAGHVVLRGRFGPEHDLPPFLIYEEQESFTRRIDVVLVEEQDASRARVHDLPLRFFDAAGRPLDATLRFARESAATWIWTIAPLDAFEIPTGARGTLTFQGPDTYVLRTIEDTLEITIEPAGTPDPTTLLLVPGRTGLHQTFAPTDVQARAVSTLD